MCDDKDGKQKEKPEPDAKPVVLSSASRINVIAALLTALGAGTLVTLAGGAITLIYFWGLGGVPFGQALNVGAMAGVVLPTSLFLFCVFLGMWLAPVLTGFAVADGKSGGFGIGAVFLRSGAKENEAPELDMRRLALFAGLCVAPIVAQTIWFACRQGSSAWDSAFFLAVLFVAGGLWLWFVRCWASQKRAGGVPTVSNLSTQNQPDASAQLEAEQAPDPNLLAWAFQFVFTSLCLVIPFGVLLLFAGQTAIARGDESFWWWLTIGLIVAALWASLVFSYLVLFKRRPGQTVNWWVLLGANSGLLLVLMLHLGVSGRTLDVVMMLSSVRVEGVNLTLTEEGCDILAAMKAQGWDRAPLPSSKTCVLENVILQSALEPNIQVACDRSMADKPPAGSASKAHFSLPSKYVLSVRKLGSAKKEHAAESVCDSPTAPKASTASASPAAAATASP